MKNTFLTLASVALLSFALSCKTNKCAEKPISGDCVCTMQYDPVCGCNNKTYSNPCMARCAGITEFKKGECPQ